MFLKTKTELEIVLDSYEQFTSHYNCFVLYFYILGVCKVIEINELQAKENALITGFYINTGKERTSISPIVYYDTNILHIGPNNPNGIFVHRKTRKNVH